MLGRKSYTKEEYDSGKKLIQQQLAAYDDLAETVGSGQARAALDVFDASFFNNLALTLDRLYVHRFSGKEYEGKDGNPLNEMRLIVDSLISHNGVMRADKQIKLPPDDSVLGIDVGDTIQLSRADFEKLSKAFFKTLKERFL